MRNEIYKNMFSNEDEAIEQRYRLFLTVLCPYYENSKTTTTPSPYDELVGIISRAENKEKYLEMIEWPEYDENFNLREDVQWFGYSRYFAEYVNFGKNGDRLVSNLCRYRTGITDTDKEEDRLQKLKNRKSNWMVNFWKREVYWDLWKPIAYHFVEDFPLTIPDTIKINDDDDAHTLIRIHDRGDYLLTLFLVEIPKLVHHIRRIISFFDNWKLDIDRNTMLDHFLHGVPEHSSIKNAIEREGKKELIDAYNFIITRKKELSDITNNRSEDIIQLATIYAIVLNYKIFNRNTNKLLDIFNNLRNNNLLVFFSYLSEKENEDECKLFNMLSNYKEYYSKWSKQLVSTGFFLFHCHTMALAYKASHGQGNLTAY